MTTTRWAWLAAGLLFAGCGTPRPAADTRTSPLDTLLTAAERSGFEATTRYTEADAFLRVLDNDAPCRVHVTSIGETGEGRAIQMAVWGAANSDSATVTAPGRTRVLVFANIHAGEVDGKEALLMLLRDLAQGQHAEWADSLVLLAVPVYNADGNERIGPDTRPLQNGPVAGAGVRPNAAGLDLNRDFVKLMAPETRALVGAIRRFDPHVIVDLHTTNGTVMAYHLTYAPPLHPNTHVGIDTAVRSNWLPSVTRGAERGAIRMWHYGNVPGAFGEPASVPRGWYSFDPRPRFSTNYAGLRNRFGLLAESYSYASFEQRVEAQRVFLEEVLGYAHRNAGRIRAVVAEADGDAIIGDSLAVRAGFGPPVMHEVLLGRVDSLRHPRTGETLLAMTDAVIPERMPAFVRFAAVERERVPTAYLVPFDQPDVVALLDLHGIRHEPQFVWGFDREAFRVDSVREGREFQGRRGLEVFGTWERVRAETGDPPRLAAYRRVPLAQPLGRLAFTLLEPRSDDGVAAWGFVAAERASDTFPILRVP